MSNPFLTAAGYSDETEEEKKKRQQGLKPSQIAAQDNKAKNDSKKAKDQTQNNPFLAAREVEKQNPKSVYNQQQSTSGPPLDTQTQDQTLVQRVQGAATSAVSAVKGVTDRLGLTKTKTPEQTQLEEQIQQIAPADYKKYSDMAIVPALAKRIKDIDDQLATGNPQKKSLVPDIIPGIPEEKVIGKVVGWATGNKTSGDALLKERNYLQQLIDGNVDSLAYQRKQVQEGKMTPQEYEKMIADQRIQAVQNISGQRFSSGVARGAVETTAGFADMTQLQADKYLQDDMSLVDAAKAGKMETPGSLVGRAIKTVTKALGGNTVAESVSKGSEQRAANLREWTNLTRQTDPTFADKIAEGVGSTAPFMAVGGVVGTAAQVLGVISPTIAAWFAAGASGAIEVASESGNVYKDNLAQGKSKKEAIEKADITFWANVGLNIFLDKFGIQNLDEASTLKRFFLAGPSEGLQELSQQVISNVATNRPFDEGVVESGVIGWIVGSGSSVITPTLEGESTENTTPLEENPFIQALPEEKKTSILTAIGGENQDLSGSLEGSGISTPDSMTSNKSPSLGVAGLSEPSSSTILTDQTGPVKSSNQTLSSNRTNFLKDFSTVAPSETEYKKYYASMQEVEPEFETTLQDLVGTDGAGYFFRMKEQSSLAAKLERKNQSKVRPLGDMNDTLAGTVVTDNLDAAVAAAQAKGVRITTDYRVSPTFLGYTGVHGELELSNGAIAEVQFQTKEIAARKEYAHEIYDKYRKYIENNGESTFDEVLAKVPDQVKTEFLADVQKSRDIYAGKVEVPQQYVDRINAQFKTVEKSGLKSETDTKISPLPDKETAVEQVSTPENRLKGADKPVTTPKGVERESRAYKNARDRIQEEFQSDVNYQSLNIAEETGKALAFVQAQPLQAIRIAKGLEKPPAGYTDTAISIAAAEQAREDGNFKLQNQLETARSLRQTRRGQEIVMEKGRVTEDSAHHYVQQVIKARLESVAKANNLVFQVINKITKEGKSKAAQAVDIIDKKASDLKKRIDKRTLANLESAQSLLDKLTCKI